MKKFSSDFPYLYTRDRIFIYRRIFKPEHQILTGKREYKISFKTRDRNKALSAYALADADFDSLLRNLSSGAISNYCAPTIEELTIRAQALGLNYIPYTQLDNLSRFLIPCFNGAILSLEWREALWARYVTGAPRPRTLSEQQYSDRKLRSRR